MYVGKFYSSKNKRIGLRLEHIILNMYMYMYMY